MRIHLFVILLILICSQSMTQILPPYRDGVNVKVGTNNNRGYDSTTTTVVLATGEGAKLPNPSTEGAFYLLWYSTAGSTYSPESDINREWIRVGVRSGDSLKSITRGYFRTRKSNHKTAGIIYRMSMSYIPEYFILKIDSMLQSGGTGGTMSGTEIMDAINENNRTVDHVWSFSDTVKFNNGLQITGTPRWTAYPSRLLYTDASGNIQGLSIPSSAKLFGGGAGNVPQTFYLVGAGGASVTVSNDTITITAGSGGGGGSITAIQNSDGRLTVVNPAGPTTTVNLTNGSLDSTALANNSVTSTKIRNGSINSIDVASTFTSPYSDTATYVRNTPIHNHSTSEITSGIFTVPRGGSGVATMPAGQVLIGNGTNAFSSVSGVSIGYLLRWNGTTWTNGLADSSGINDSSVTTRNLRGNSVTSAKILNGTIQRIDVSSSFKAPFADTSDYARATSMSGAAGGDLTGTFPNPTIGNEKVTRSKIDPLLLLGTNAFINRLAYWVSLDSIGYLDMPVSMFDTTSANHFSMITEAHDASKLRGTASSSVLPVVATGGHVSFGNDGGFDFDQNGRVLTAYSGTFMSAGMGGTSNLYTVDATFEATATADTVTWTGMRSYYTVFPTLLPVDSTTAVTSADLLSVFPTGGKVFVHRQANTSGALHYSLTMKVDSLSTPYAVQIPSTPTSSSIIVNWTLPNNNIYATTRGVIRQVVTYDTAFISSPAIITVARNGYVGKDTCHSLTQVADTLTGLTALRDYKIQVWLQTFDNFYSSSGDWQQAEALTASGGAPSTAFSPDDSVTTATLTAWYDARDTAGHTEYSNAQHLGTIYSKAKIQNGSVSMVNQTDAARNFRPTYITEPGNDTTRYFLFDGVDTTYLTTHTGVQGDTSYLAGMLEGGTAGHPRNLSIFAVLRDSVPHSSVGMIFSFDDASAHSPNTHNYDYIQGALIYYTPNNSDLGIRGQRATFDSAGVLVVGRAVRNPAAIYILPVADSSLYVQTFQIVEWRITDSTDGHSYVEIFKNSDTVKARTVLSDTSWRSHSDQFTLGGNRSGVTSTDPLGTKTPGSFQLAEMLIYKGVPSITERKNIRNYLGGRHKTSHVAE